MLDANDEHGPNFLSSIFGEDAVKQRALHLAKKHRHDMIEDMGKQVYLELLLNALAHDDDPKADKLAHLALRYAEIFYLANQERRTAEENADGKKN